MRHEVMHVGKMFTLDEKYIQDGCDIADPTNMIVEEGRYVQSSFSSSCSAATLGAQKTFFLVRHAARGYG